jgi:hypothetical protein
MSDDDLITIGQRIGYSDTPAELFGISRLDRRRHLYAQGKTGSGKSTLAISMMVQDLHRGEGVCLIDPLGHIAETVLAYVPKARTDEVCYLNVADLERPVGLNILAGYAGEERHKIVAAGVDAFASVWDLSLARQPLLLDTLGYTLAALTEVPGATLLVLPRFLSDQGYRERLVESHVTDLAVRSYWSEFGRRSGREQRDMCGSVLNKANELRREPLLRNLFGQEHNKLDIGALIRDRGILIVNLAKAEIGRENARLVGAFLISQIAIQASARTTALARCEQDDPNRAHASFPDFYVYVDEFQDLATAKFDDALSQSRNGRVSFALFNQFQAQLSDEVRGALFGNVGTLISFEVSANDAKQLSAEFDGHFSPNELTALRAHEIALKLPKREGNPSHPFKAYTIEHGWSGYGAQRRENIIAQSRMRFGRPRERVELSIERALRPVASKQPTKRARPGPAVNTTAHGEERRETKATAPRRCSLCNEAGFLELRHIETGKLMVHRCPHELEMVTKIEQGLRAYRLGGGDRPKPRSEPAPSWGHGWHPMEHTTGRR